MFLSIKSFKSLFIFFFCFIFFFDFVYMSFMVSNQFLQAPPIVYECRWTSTATRVLYAPRPTSDGVTSRERRSIEGTTILATGRDEGDLQLVSSLNGANIIYNCDFRLFTSCLWPLSQICHDFIFIIFIPIFIWFVFVNIIGHKGWKWIEKWMYVVQACISLNMPSFLLFQIVLLIKIFRESKHTRSLKSSRQRLCTY